MPSASSEYRPPAPVSGPPGRTWRQYAGETWGDSKKRDPILGIVLGLVAVALLIGLVAYAVTGGTGTANLVPKVAKKTEKEEEEEEEKKEETGGTSVGQSDGKKEGSGSTLQDVGVHVGDASGVGGGAAGAPAAGGEGVPSAGGGVAGGGDFEVNELTYKDVLRFPEDYTAEDLQWAEAYEQGYRRNDPLTVDIKVPGSKVICLKNQNKGGMRCNTNCPKVCVPGQKIRVWNNDPRKGVRYTE